WTSGAGRPRSLAGWVWNCRPRTGASSISRPGSRTATVCPPQRARSSTSAPSITRPRMSAASRGTIPRSRSRGRSRPLPCSPTRTRRSPGSITPTYPSTMDPSPFAPRCVLVTGGAGFIGGNFVRWLLEHDPAVRIVNLDLLTYAGNLESLSDVFQRHGPEGDGRHFFVRGDVRDFDVMRALLAGKRTPAPDAVVHMAAESHVDRPIMGPA